MYLKKNHRKKFFFFSDSGGKTTMCEINNIIIYKKYKKTIKILELNNRSDLFR